MYFFNRLDTAVIFRLRYTHVFHLAIQKLLASRDLDTWLLEEWTQSSKQEKAGDSSRFIFDPFCSPANGQFFITTDEGIRPHRRVSSAGRKRTAPLELWEAKPSQAQAKHKARRMPLEYPDLIRHAISIARRKKEALAIGLIHIVTFFIVCSNNYEKRQQQQWHRRPNDHRIDL